MNGETGTVSAGNYAKGDSVSLYVTAMPEGEKPQQTFMSTDEYSLATLPGSKSEYFPAILTAKCGIDKWTLALMR